MVARDEGWIVLWPDYFDVSLSRSRGRRVPKRVAVNSPTIEEIHKAARRLKLAPHIESEKAHPRQPWRKTGRVLVRPAQDLPADLRRKEVILYSVGRTMRYPKKQPRLGKPKPKPAKVKVRTQGSARGRTKPTAGAKTKVVTRGKKTKKSIRRKVKRRRKT